MHIPFPVSGCLFPQPKESRRSIHDQPQILICPGYHDPQFTQEFGQGLDDYCHQSRLPLASRLVCPTSYSAHSASQIWQFMEDSWGKNRIFPELAIISFSAGVVGAIGAAWAWRLQGRTIKAFIAIDGWGVPLYGDFPIYRLSHDHFTHWSSGLWDNGQDRFYADPPVSHLDLWRMPHQVRGWQIGSNGCYQTSTAAEFITKMLYRHGVLKTI